VEISVEVNVGDLRENNSGDMARGGGPVSAIYKSMDF
jgi:hypothetical protein